MRELSIVKEMTARERVIAALNHEEGDRVPIWDLIDNKAVYEYFSPGETDTLKMAAKTYAGLGIDATRAYLVPENGIEAKSPAGDVRKLRCGQTSWVIRRSVNTLDDLDDYDPHFPSYQELTKNYVTDFKRKRDAFAPHTVFIGYVNAIFFDAFRAIPLDVFSLAIHDKPREIRRIMKAYTQHSLNIITAYAEHRLGPAFMICEDIAYKGRLMFSPEFLKRKFFPRLKKLTEPLLNAKIKVLFHSDGYIMDILDDLIEAGIEGINPIEPLAGNDISYIKRRYGKRLVLLGNVDCSQVLPLATPEEIRQATRKCIRATSPGGGHFIGSSSEITPAVPLENALAFFRAAKEYGKYPIR